MTGNRYYNHSNTSNAITNKNWGKKINLSGGKRFKSIISN